MPFPAVAYIGNIFPPRTVAGVLYLLPARLRYSNGDKTTKGAAMRPPLLDSSLSYMNLAYEAGPLSGSFSRYFH